MKLAFLIMVAFALLSVCESQSSLRLLKKKKNGKLITKTTLKDGSKLKLYKKGGGITVLMDSPADVDMGKPKPDSRSPSKLYKDLTGKQAPKKLREAEKGMNSSANTLPSKMKKPPKQKSKKGKKAKKPKVRAKAIPDDGVAILSWVH